MHAATVLFAGCCHAGANQQQQQQLPLLGSSHDYERKSGLAIRVMARVDAWFVLPRVQLVQLLPALTGMQQLVFGYAGVLWSLWICVMNCGSS
jgi:hypothetical protein